MDQKSVGEILEVIRHFFRILVGRKCGHTATAGLRVEWGTVRVCGCTGTTVNRILTYFTYTHSSAARRKQARQGDCLMAVGRAFHARGPATGKAFPPRTVWSTLSTLLGAGSGRFWVRSAQ